MSNSGSSRSFSYFENFRERIGAISAIDDILEDTLNAVKTLKVVIPNLFRDDAGKLAEWAAAFHVERAPKPPEPALNP